MIPPPSDDQGVRALPSLPPSKPAADTSKDRDSQKSPSQRTKGTMPLYSEADEDEDKIAELLQ